MGRQVLVGVALALVLAGCGPQGEPHGEGSSSARSPVTVRDEPDSIERLCGVESDGDYLELRTESEDSVLPGYVMGSATDAVVLLPQVTGKSCDWVAYAQWLARRDVTVLAVDLCGLGRSTCSDDLADDPAGQVQLAVDHLRDEGADRVTLVGASMGGAIAEGVADEVGADAVVAVSPPPEWDGVDDVDTAAGSITVPWLLVAARGDSGIDPARLEEAREGSDAPGGYREVPGSDHGYALITDGMVTDAQILPLGREILRWITGEAPPA